MDTLNLPNYMPMKNYNFSKDILKVIIFSFIIYFLTYRLAPLLPDAKAEEELKRLREKQYEYLYANNITPLSLLAFSLKISITSSISEELIYRFFLMKIILIDTLKINSYISIFVSSLIYASFQSSLIKFIYKLFIGISYGYFYKETGNLYIVMISHFIKNVIINSSHTMLYKIWYDKKKAGITPNEISNILLYNELILPNCLN